MQTLLFLIRHGETEWTRKKRFQGNTDIELTSRGRKQAAALGRRLKDSGIDILYASPLKRAAESARILSKSLKKKPFSDKRLCELGFGEWEGKSPAELLEQKNSRYREWCRGKLVSPRGGEPLKAFRKRVGSFYRDILRRHRGKRIAIVTHGGPVKIFIYEALKLPYRSLWSFRVEPASLSVIAAGDHFSQVWLQNDTSHLAAGALGVPREF